VGRADRAAAGRHRVSYVVSPGALGAVATDPAGRRTGCPALPDRALAARVVREVAELTRRADAQGKRLATLGLGTEVAFRSAAERVGFADELAAAVTGLVARYHAPDAPGARPHRLVVAAHPIPDPEESR